MVEFAMCVAVAVTIVLTASFIYYTYGGDNDSLVGARVGSTYNFIYEQPLTGTYDRYLARVKSVRKFTVDDVRRMNFTSNYRLHDKLFTRGNTLVTCELPDGTIRNFYAERTSSCRRSLTGGLLYTLGVASMF